MKPIDTQLNSYSAFHRLFVQMTSRIDELHTRLVLHYLFATAVLTIYVGIL
jgi:hypothetical protein